MSDWAEFNKAAKERYDAIRAQKYNRFENEILPLIEANNDVSKGKNFDYFIESDEHGLLHYYPKADRVHVKRLDKWFHYGITWMKNNGVIKELK